MSRSQLYGTWAMMRARCSNPDHKAYPDYGGRGVTVCERWKSFENFIADMGERPAGMTLDRIDNDKGYSPENCRWATRKQQNNNSRKNRLLTHEGRTQTLSAWAGEAGLSRGALLKRLARGWTLAESLTVAATRNKPQRRKAP